MKKVQLVLHMMTRDNTSVWFR
uniref:Uncharacterized protein n=1 Tax=Anguilla anguilla TaxID=7936 RepID=A0A0E9SP76_ANGAN